MPDWIQEIDVPDKYSSYKTVILSWMNVLDEYWIESIIWNLSSAQNILVKLGKKSNCAISNPERKYVPFSIFDSNWRKMTSYLAQLPTNETKFDAQKPNPTKTQRYFVVNPHQSRNYKLSYCLPISFN